MLVDTFGRVATDLRVSLTDKCNLRCSYCMPAEGLEWLPGPELLTDDELVRLVGVAVSLGVTEVRFTGGEPLLRRGLVSIVERVGALRPAAADVGDHQRHRAGPGRPGAGRRRAGPGQRVAGHPGPGAVRHDRRGATGWPTCWPGWPRPPTPASRRSRSTRC